MSSEINKVGQKAPLERPPGPGFGQLLTSDLIRSIGENTISATSKAVKAFENANPLVKNSCSSTPPPSAKGVSAFAEGIFHPKKLHSHKK